MSMYIKKKIVILFNFFNPMFSNISFTIMFKKNNQNKVKLILIGYRRLNSIQINKLTSLTSLSLETRFALTPESITFCYANTIVLARVWGTIVTIYDK